MTGDSSEDEPAGGDRSTTPGRRALVLGILLAIGLYAVGLGVVGVRDALSAVSRAAVIPLLGALTCQVLVTATWPMVHRATVRALGQPLRYPEALNVSMSAFTVSHTVPGGGAVGAAVVVERLTGFGLSGPRATAAATLTGPIVLTTIFGFGTVGITAAVLAGELAEIALVLAVLGLAGLVALVSLIVAGIRRPWVGERVIGALGRVSSRLRERADGWRDSWRLVTEQAPTGRQIGVVFAWSCLKWGADIAALALVFLAYGQTPRPTALLVGFGVSQVAAAIPVTPGGVGFVEGGMVAAFTALGVALPVATTVVLTYRILETWLPSLAGVPMLLRPPAARGASEA